MQPQRNEPGIYTLILSLPGAQKIVVGSMGVIDFAGGYYSYTGSARGPGGLKRVDRHIRVSEGTNTTRRWHIDYLLPHTSLLETFITKTSLDLECRIAKAMEERLAAVPGFGCTDCRCISHLHYSRNPGEMRAVAAAAHRAAMI
ncbi:MAG: GIY-YIG nuclease family protein [Methanothrix sp.]|jgi:endonuclease-3|nr:GIY-YIG nuclease family protein [Methanothrix sp.]